MCERQKGQFLIMERGRERTLMKKMVDGWVFTGVRSSRSVRVEGSSGAGFSEDDKGMGGWVQECTCVGCSMY